MRFYATQHQFTCGIDLHARSMYVCILDAAGTIVVHKDLPATPEHFLRVLAPYRADLAVAVECIFTWYWLADLCAREGIAFVLEHALYMKAIHGGKAKHDRIDAHKIAVLLRGGMLPMAYVYPAAMRAPRDLLRRRCHLMRKRAELLTHIQNTVSQYNLPALGKKRVRAFSRISPRTLRVAAPSPLPPAMRLRLLRTRSPAGNAGEGTWSSILAY
jgi:hypothetical protein